MKPLGHTQRPPPGNAYGLDGAAHVPSPHLVIKEAAPMGAAERLKHLQPQLDEAMDDVRNRRHAVALAVKASNGDRDDLQALAVLFNDLKRAEDVCKHLRNIRESLSADAKAEGANHG